MNSEISEDLMPTPLLLLPIDEDEAYVSYLNRISVFAEKSLLHRPGKRFSLLFPSAVKLRFPSILSLKPINALLSEHFHNPLFEPYLTEPQRKRLGAHTSDSTQDRIAHMTGMAAFPQPNGRVRICHACVAEDDSKKRIPIWRRASLVPGVLHCPRHGQRYWDLCGRCVEGSRYSVTVRLLRRTCFCGGPLRLSVPIMSEIGEEASIRMSEFIQFTIEGGLSHLSPERIRHAYREQARKLGLISAGGPANARGLEGLFDASGAGELARSLGLKTGTRSVLRRCIVGKSFSTNPVVNAIVQSMLFATPQDFVDAARPDAPRHMPIPSEKEKRRLKNLMEKIESLCADRGVLTRAEFRRLFHSQARKLLHQYKYDWLEEKVPRNPVVIPCKDNRGIPKPKDIDARAVNRIESRFRELSSDPNLPRFTRRALVEGCYSESTWCTNARMERLPRAIELVASLVETKEQHSLRQMKNWLPHISSPETIPHHVRRLMILKWRQSK